MEFAIVLAVVLGVALGLVMGAIGALLWTARTRARLESESALIRQRLEMSQQDNVELKNRVSNAEADASEGNQEAASLRTQLVTVNTRLAEQLNLEKLMADKFKALSAEAISDNSDKFLKNANERIGTLVKPLSEELKRIETDRATSQGSLKQQIETLAQSSKTLERETRNLSTALKRPEVRGAWGEIQLRRVVELAGMADYCDFEEQVSVPALNGGQDRPDMVVRMPNERTIVIDAKTPMSAYLSATESQTEDERQKALDRHSGQLKERARSLSQKRYWQAFDRSPDFVVMFLPGEFLLQPALEREPELMDWAMEQRVVIATPHTLMALLKTVEMGWREVRLARDAEEVGRLGKQIHERLQTWAEHMVRMGNSLNQTVRHFNSGVGSLESRVLTSARRLKELGVASSEEIPEIPAVDTQVRELSGLPSPSDVPALPSHPKGELSQPSSPADGVN